MEIIKNRKKLQDYIERQKEMGKLVEMVGFPSLDITRDPFYQSSLDEEKKKRLVEAHTRSVKAWVELEKQAEELKDKYFSNMGLKKLKN